MIYLGICVCVCLYALLSQMLKNKAELKRIEKLGKLSTEKIKALTELKKASGGELLNIEIK